MCILALLFCLHLDSHKTHSPGEGVFKTVLRYPVQTLNTCLKIPDFPLPQVISVSSTVITSVLIYHKIVSVYLIGNKH